MTTAAAKNPHPNPLPEYRARGRERRGHRRGYVLVMVMGLLVLAATLLVAVSRTAGRAAMTARAAEEELQHRWGVVSCRKAVLPYVETMLTSLEQERRRAVPRFET